MRYLSVIMLLALSACATLTAGNEQTITVSTTPEQGASCTVTNGEKSWEIEKTPAPVVVKRAFKELRIICSKESIGSGTTKAKAGTRGRAYGNILLLGVPALVDASTGAGYEYPNSITVELAPTL